MKFLNLKLVIPLEHQNIKTFLQKTMFQIGLKKFFSLKTLKTQCHGHMLLVISMEKKCLERLTKKNCKKKKKQIKKSLELKEINYISNGKALIILLTVGLIKKDIS